MAKIKGLNEWSSWLNRQMQVTETRVKQEVKKHGGLVERDAKRLAAVDSGDMRQSINSEIVDAGFTAEISAMAINPKNNFDYAIANEFGTVKMTAQPFMKPSFDNTVPKLEKALNKVANDIGG